MNKIFRTVLGLIVLVLVVWGIQKSTSDTDSDGSIKVGIIAPLTGPAAAYGVEGKNSVVLALDEINSKGGIKGKKIEYIIEDGKCDAPTALSAWNKLVSLDKVQVIFGGHCSTESVAIAPLSAKDQIPVLAVFATAPKIENEGEWFFRHISTNEYYGTVLADQAYEKGYRKVALITEQKDFPASYSDAFIAEFKKLGGTIVLDERFGPEVKDYRSLAFKAKDSGPDAIFVSTQGPSTMAIVVKQMHELGIEKPVLFNHAFTYAKFILDSNGYMPKEYLVIQPLADANSPKVQAFNKAYVEKFGSLYTFNSYFITADYDMVNRFKDAAEVCLDTTLDIGCLRNQFKTAKTYSGVAGDVEISSKFSPFGVLTPVATMKVVDGKETFVPIK